VRKRQSRLSAAQASVRLINFLIRSERRLADRDARGRWQSASHQAVATLASGFCILKLDERRYRLRAPWPN